MPDLQNLLDQIDLLDRTATTGPWILETDTHRDLIKSPADDQINLVATVVSPIMDSQLIALSRTAMPALAQAVRAVLELHRPETRWSYEPEPEYSFRTRPGLLDHFGLDGEPYNPSHISQWQICAYCAEVEQGAAEDLGHLTALWPCTTYKTITKALGDDE